MCSNAHRYSLAKIKQSYVTRQWNRTTLIRVISIGHLLSVHATACRFFTELNTFEVYQMNTEHVFTRDRTILTSRNYISSIDTTYTIGQSYLAHFKTSINLALYRKAILSFCNTALELFRKIVWENVLRKKTTNGNFAFFHFIHAKFDFFIRKGNCS